MAHQISKATIFGHNFVSPLRFAFDKVVGKNIDGTHHSTSVGEMLATMVVVGVLPITLLIGAPLKTLYDIKVRTAIPEDEISEVKEKISSMSPDELRVLALKIGKHIDSTTITGSESNTLYCKLAEILVRTNAAVDAKKIKDNPLDKTEAVTADGLKKLQDEFHTFVEEQMANEKIKLSNVLFAYIDSPVNQGKKLQHFIKDTVLQMNITNSFQNVALN